MVRLIRFLKGLWPTKEKRSVSTGGTGVAIKTDKLSTPTVKRFVPIVGAEVNMGGFKYRIRKVTAKDVVLRPVGFA